MSLEEILFRAKLEDIQTYVSFNCSAVGDNLTFSIANCENKYLGTILEKNLKEGWIMVTDVIEIRGRSSALSLTKTENTVLLLYSSKSTEKRVDIEYTGK